jgi:hypothetical protein
MLTNGCETAPTVTIGKVEVGAFYEEIPHNGGSVNTMIAADYPEYVIFDYILTDTDAFIPASEIGNSVEIVIKIEGIGTPVSLGPVGMAVAAFAGQGEDFNNYGVYEIEKLRVVHPALFDDQSVMSVQN